jgi:hypothetical protein
MRLNLVKKVIKLRIVPNLKKKINKAVKLKEFKMSKKYQNLVS